MITRIINFIAGITAGFFGLVTLVGFLLWDGLYFGIGFMGAFIVAVLWGQFSSDPFISDVEVKSETLYVPENWSRTAPLG